MIPEFMLMISLGTPITVPTTGYCGKPPCVDQRYADGRTASGSYVQQGSCAADWSVFPKGTWLFIPRYGLCRVEDTGRLVRGAHIDLYFPDIADAVQWGRQQTTIRRVQMKIHGTEQTYHVEDQFSVVAWATHTFGRPSALAALRRSCDELLEALELCVVNNKETHDIFRSMRLALARLDHYAQTDAIIRKLRPSIAEELADSAIVNYHAAQVLNIDLHSWIDRKMEINRRRRWETNEDGTGQHVDEDIILNSVDQEEEWP